MMKNTFRKLFLIWLFSGSLDGFSQEIKTLEYPPKPVAVSTSQVVKRDSIEWRLPVVNPDTIRAICLVTLFQNGIAHSRMGFVVVERGKRPVYLDCNKKALKLPMVGWGYEVVGEK